MTDKITYVPRIGLEIHVALSTNTKAFCGCAVSFAEAPNTNCCPVCLGLPGGLPTLNEAVVENAVMLATALNAQIQMHSMFDRKHYFYPDLPKGYQITQQSKPIALGGYISLSDEAKVVLRQIHIEEDAAKLVHHGEETWCDFNRAGIPLLEIVTQPCITSGAQAAECVRAVRTLVQYLHISSGQMQEGALRCDVNISLHKAGAAEKKATRVEVKNLNSFHSIVAAVDFEVARQRKLLENNKEIVAETRGFVDADKTTIALREKESVHEYCYLPEPDLAPLIIEQAYISAIQEQMPLLPEALKEIFANEYGLKVDDIVAIIANEEVCELFMQTMRSYESPISIAKLILSEVLRQYQLTGICKVGPGALAKLAEWVDHGRISFATAKKTIEAVWATGQAPRGYIDTQDLWQMQEEGLIADAVQKVIQENAPIVADYIKGKQRAQEVLIGKAIGALGAKADAKIVRRLMAEELYKKTQQ